MTVEADVIVLAGVHFMAETAEIAQSGQDGSDPRSWRRLLARRVDPAGRRAAPAARLSGVPVVTYVNTSAAVKAESDICCTSAMREPLSNRLASNGS